MLVLDDNSGDCGYVGRRRTLNAAFENPFDVSTMRGALAGDRQSALTRGVHRGCAVLVGDADDAKHGTKAHLGLRILSHGAARDLCNVRPELAGPFSHSLWRPLAVVPVLAWAVLGCSHRDAGARVAAAVRRDAHATVETLDNARRRAHLDDFAAQLERHAVQSVVEFDMVVDVGSRPLALRQLEAERWKRFHARPVQRLECLASGARQLLEAPCVELVDQLRDG